MGFAKGVFIGVLSLATIILIIVLSLTAVSYTLLYPNTYTSALEEAGFFSVMEKNFEKIDGAFFIKLPHEGLRYLFEDLLDRIFSYIRSDTDELNLTVEVDREKIKTFFIGSIEALPLCDTTTNPLDPNANCKPSNKVPEEFLDQILESRNVTVLENDYVDLGSVYGISDNSEGIERLNKLREFVSLYQKILIATFLIIVLFIFLIYLVKKNSKKSFLRILGIIFLLSSTILLLSANTFISNKGELMNITKFSSENNLLKNAGEIFIERLIYRVYTESIIGLVLGSVLILVSFFINSPDKVGKKSKEKR